MHLHEKKSFIETQTRAYTRSHGLNARTHAGVHAGTHKLHKIPEILVLLWWTVKVTHWEHKATQTIYTTRPHAFLLVLGPETQSS